MFVDESRVTRAYNELMTELFGKVPKDPSQLEVDYDTYKEKMKEVQERHGLKEGEKDFVLWILTIISRTPKLIEKEGDGA